jgi:hypothetical protein
VIFLSCKANSRVEFKRSTALFSSVMEVCSQRDPPPAPRHSGVQLIRSEPSGFNPKATIQPKLFSQILSTREPPQLTANFGIFNNTYSEVTDYYKLHIILSVLLQMLLCDTICTCKTYILRQGFKTRRTCNT